MLKEKVQKNHTGKNPKMLKENVKEKERENSRSILRAVLEVTGSNHERRYREMS